MTDSVCFGSPWTEEPPYRSTASVIREFEGGHTLLTTHSQIDLNNKENKANDISICGDLISALIYVQKINISKGRNSIIYPSRGSGHVLATFAGLKK